MENYLTAFLTESEYLENRNSLPRPNVSYILENKKVLYNPLKEYKEQYLTFEILENDAYINFKRSDEDAPEITIQYSVDEENWSSIIPSTEGVEIGPFSEGQMVYLKGNNHSIGYMDYGNVIYTTNSVNVFGNIFSLTNGDNFTNISQTVDYMFYELFHNCTGLIDASNLILPATTLGDYSYTNMFQGCTSLTKAPKLPSTTLGEECYGGMFQGCTSLVNAPSLPATTLAMGCYNYMFRDCSSLESAPELPATTLAPACYSGMFYGCTSLVNAPELPATTLVNSCYSQMFFNCSSLINIPRELPSTTLAMGCYDSMFANCTSLVNAPELPATTLTQSCYKSMFINCSHLKHVKCLATDISASNCTASWMMYVPSGGTFVKSPSMTSWPLNSADGIPTGWEVYALPNWTIAIDDFWDIQNKDPYSDEGFDGLFAEINVSYDDTRDLTEQTEEALHTWSDRNSSSMYNIGSRIYNLVDLIYFDNDVKLLWKLYDDGTDFEIFIVTPVLGNVQDFNNQDIERIFDEWFYKSIYYSKTNKFNPILAQLNPDTTEYENFVPYYGEHDFWYDGPVLVRIYEN